MSRERLFCVRSARSGGGRSRCRVVYRPAFRNMWQLFRPRAVRVAFPRSRREASFQGPRGARRGVSTGDDGPGRAASESCGRFRKTAHVFVCRFDLADSCGFRPDGPVLSPAFENMRIVRAIMFFNVPNNVCTWDFAPTGCGSRSQAAHPVRTLPRILAAGGGLVQGAERVEDSTVGTEKVNEAREVRRTCRAAGTGM